MRFATSLATSLLSLLTLSNPTTAVFTDDAFHVDYHHALLGTPQSQTTFFHRPHPSTNASLLYSLSERGLLGAVNPRDGGLVWRTDLFAAAGLESGDEKRSVVESFLRPVVSGDVVVGALGGLLGAWDGRSGRVVWEKRFEDGPVVDVEALEMEGSKTGDLIVLFGESEGVVRRIGGDGEVLWEYKDEKGDTPFQVASSSTKVFYISLTTSVLGGYKIRITTLDPVTGKPTSQFSLGADSDLASISDIIFVGSNTASPILAWTDKAKKTLKVNVIGVKPVTTIAIDNKSGEPIEDVKVVAPRHTPSQPHFLIHYRTKSFGWAVVYHTDLTTNNVSKSHRIPVVKENDVFAVSNLDANVYFTRVTEKEVSLTSSRSADVLGKWPRTDEQVSEPGSHLIAEVVAKPDKTYAVRYAQTLESGDWELGQNGVQVWLRPESVAGAVLAEWAEPQVEEALARELDVEGHQNVLAAYIHRVKRHARDIQLYFPGWIQALPFRIMSSFVATEATSVDAFGFGKTVILATEKGRLIALDTGKMGKIVWNVRIGSEHWEPKAIFVQGAIVTVYAADGSFVKVAVANGAVVEEGSLGQKVKTLAQIPGATETLTLAVSEDGTVQPFSGSVLPNTLLVTLSEDSKAVGWKLDSETPIPLWTFKPAAGQKLVSATARPAHDPISSIGKVLGDRSVLYKYINPNLAFLTATSEAENTVTFYLLDSISGQVLYTASHRDVDTKQPITSTMSENWFAYSFFSTAGSSSSAQGNQLIIAEMYESSLANDRGSLDSAQNYSSLYSPEPNAPHVISQSYIIPEPISSLSTSQTRQGITTKYLLATLPNSNALVGIPRGVLNPRRTLDRDPTPAEAEEGLFRYAPFLDFDGRWYLSHGREVMGINKVTSVMTGLESTGLVLAFGNDIFGTRVAPSGGFDYLGKGFNKVQLVLTVVGLAIGVTMLAPMVRRKQVNQRWQITA